jgi:general secretion pathway protein G
MVTRMHTHRKDLHGFTMIELVVVMAMLGLLLSIALPKYMATLERGREQVLRQNLVTMREAIDKFYGDRGRYPDSLDDLVTFHYLRAIPDDPFTETPVWLVVEHRDSAMGGVIDVRSTLTDIKGQPRAPSLPPEGGAAAPVNFAVREAGATRVVVPGIASAPNVLEEPR